MKKLLISIAVLFTTTVSAQTDEWYSEAYPQLRTNQKIIRTDQQGNVVWKKEISEITGDDCGVYIIASSTKIKNGQIISNPSDYDYWLIDEKILNDTIIVCPTICTNQTTIFIGGSYPRDIFLDIFNQEGKLVKFKELSIGENEVLFSDLSSGIYFLTIGTDLPYEEKTFKIMIQK